MTDIAEIVDAQRLGDYLDAHLDGPSRPVRVEKHTAGFSQETFFVYRGDDAYVLRRPPRGDLLPTAHDVTREHRFLAALADTPARVPRPIILCEDPEVIGAPFYLMERKFGVVVREELPPYLDPPEERRRMGEELIDALAEIHTVDWRAAGLTGKPEGYLDRQIARWRGQAEARIGRVRELPGVARLTRWIEANKPEQQGAAIVQGDYKLDNVMFANEAPARLIAVFDWEMATVGDPLADLGYFLNTWNDPSRAGDADQPLTAMPGFSSVDELAARYSERTGRAVRDLDWYRVLAAWKGIVIVENLYIDYIDGNASNPGAAEFEVRVPRMVDRAIAMIEEAR